MKELRKMIQKLILEACNPGDNFDDDTGMPCTGDPNAWTQYMHNQQQQQLKQFQNMVNQFQQDIQNFDSSQEAVENTIEDKAQEEEDWQKPWERMKELNAEYETQIDRFNEWYLAKMKELRDLAIDVIPWGSFKKLDFCNKWLKHAKVDPVERPLPFGQLLSKVIVGRTKRYQDLFHDEIEDIREFYHKKFMKAIEDGLSVEKVEKISKTKMGDLLRFEKDYKSELEELSQIYSQAAEDAKSQGKGWILGEDGKQFQMER